MYCCKSTKEQQDNNNNNNNNNNQPVNAVNEKALPPPTWWQRHNVQPNNFAPPFLRERREAGIPVSIVADVSKLFVCLFVCLFTYLFCPAAAWLTRLGEIIRPKGLLLIGSQGDWDTEALQCILGMK